MILAWEQTNFSVPPIKRRLYLALTAAGALILAAGMLLAPQRAWLNVLLISYGLVCVGLGGLFFVALQYVTGAGWSVVVRRPAEAMTFALPLGAAGMLLVFLLQPSLYPWMGGHGEIEHGFKALWLNRPFFIARAVLYMAVWLLLSRAIIRNSRRQDASGGLLYTRRNAKLSAAFMVVFAITFWLASFDWIMSLEPHWYSTIFGVYHFAGMFESALAIIILLTVWLQARGPLKHLVTGEHLHDLGKLLFAFATFWMYIWFCQYMLIWYADIPEETVYFARRMHGFYQPLILLNIFLNWVAPFLVLMPLATKRSPSTIARVAAAVLAGRWLDLYLMILPSAGGEAPSWGIWEIGGIALLAGLLTLVVHRGLRGAPVLPLRDPYLHESLQHQQ